MGDLELAGLVDRHAIDATPASMAWRCRRLINAEPRPEAYFSRLVEARSRTMGDLELAGVASPPTP